MNSHSYEPITDTPSKSMGLMLSQRSEALASRLEKGATALAAYAAALSDDEWQTRVPKDGRKVGVVVHHVASMYPLEMELAHVIAKGDALVGVTWDVVADINAKHARDFDRVSKAEALDLLRRNSAAAADAIRALNDEDLDRAVLQSLYSDAPLTTGFWLEDHPVRHSYHHLARLKAAVKLQPVEV
jgi:hypothetical protein